MFGRAPKKSEVDKSASSDELKKAYHKAAIKNHPDKGSDPEKFKELTQAYEVLSDPEKREVYYQCGEDALKEGMGGGGSNNPFDIFESFFGDAEMDKSNEELCKTKLLYSTTIPTLKDQEVVDDEESQSACAGMDVADLPQDDGVWSPMLLFEEMAWDSIDETEKACSDRMMPSTSGTPIFSKVFAVGHGQGAAFVAIPNTYKPSKGSPSKLIKAQPTLLEDAINATQRIKICYKDTGGNDHTSYATGFAVSSTVMLTAKHVVDKQTVTQIRTFGGINVPANIFETTASMEGKDVLTTSKPCSRARDTHGLFLKGADVGCFTTKGFFNSFLLPCSPTFLSTDTVAILSFPGVDKFLKNAKWELIKDNASKSLIWKQYLPAMQSVYESTTREYAATHGIRKSKAKALDSLSKTVSKEVKKKLYDELMKTFGIGHTGNMLCSVGHILCRNKASLGTSCSTLAGSSGAAVVPLCRPGEFVGIQRGGCEGYDLNCTTSTDNQEFVEFYMSNALPTLPHPNNSCWTNRRIDGFHHWLRLHGVHIPISSPWRGVLQGKNELKSSKRKALWA